MHSVTSSVRGSQDFSDLCRGTVKGYSFNLVRLFEECQHECCEKARKSKNRINLSFQEAVSRLRNHAKETLQSIDTERRILEFYIGKSYVMSRKGVSFDPMNYSTWTLEDGLNGTWKHSFKPKDYDGLVAIACIERNIIQKELRQKNEAVDQEFYSSALTQSLIHHFSITNPDRRCKNICCEAGPKWKTKYKAGVIYIAFKCEEYENSEFSKQDCGFLSAEKEKLMDQITQLEESLAKKRPKKRKSTTGSSGKSSESFDPDKPLTNWHRRNLITDEDLSPDLEADVIKLEVDDESMSKFQFGPFVTEKEADKGFEPTGSFQSSPSSSGMKFNSSTFPRSKSTKPSATNAGNPARAETLKSVQRKHKLQKESDNSTKYQKTNSNVELPKQATVEQTAQTTSKPEGITNANLSKFQSILLESLNTIKQRRAIGHHRISSSDISSDQRRNSTTKADQEKQNTFSQELPKTETSETSNSEIVGDKDRTPSQEVECLFSKLEVSTIAGAIRMLYDKGLSFCTLTNLNEILADYMHVFPQNERSVVKERIAGGQYGNILNDVLRRLELEKLQT